MNERGHYGNRNLIGADASTLSRDANRREPNAGGAETKGSPWIGPIIVAAVIGGSWLFFGRHAHREMKEFASAAKTRAREAGLKPGMSQAEQDRAWDAHYTKKGLKLDEAGNLVRARTT